MSRKKEPVRKKKEPIDYIKIVKIADPIFQTIFIITIVFLFDRRGNKYQSVLAYLVRLQVFSALVNLFLKFSGKLKLERYLFFLGVGLWLAGDRMYYQFKLKGGVSPTASVILGKGPTIFNLYDTIYAITGMAVALWYFSISFREVNKLVKSRRKVKRG